MYNETKEFRTYLLNADFLTEEMLERLNSLLAQLKPDATPLTLETVEQISKRAFMFAAAANDDDADIIGMMTIDMAMLATGEKWRIEDVVVDKAWRGRGVGRLLIETAINLAGRNRGAELTLTSRPQREAANKLYQSLGFQRKETNVYVMHVEAKPKEEPQQPEAPATPYLYIYKGQNSPKQ